MFPQIYSNENDECPCVLADNWSAAVQVSPMELGLHTSYLHKLNPQQSVGVELDGKVATGECVATLGYCFEIPAAETTVKGD